MKEFCSYEISNLLKEKGFDEDCLAYYHSSNNELIVNNIPNYSLEKYNLGIAAPLFQQAIMWLMKKLDLKFPYIKFVIFSDCSGYIESTDDNICIMFVDLGNSILEALNLI